MTARDAALAEREAALDSLRREQTALAASLDDARTTIAEMSAARDEADGRLAQLQAALDEAVRAQAELRTSLDEAAAARAGAEAAVARERAEWSVRCEGLLVERDAARAELDAQRAQAEALAAEVAEAKVVIEDAARLKASLDADNQALQQLRQDLLRFNDDMDNRYKALLERQRQVLATDDAPGVKTA